MESLLKMPITFFCILTILGVMPLWAADEEINKAQASVSNQGAVSVPESTNINVSSHPQGALQTDATPGAQVAPAEGKAPGVQQDAPKAEAGKDQGVPAKKESGFRQIFSKVNGITKGQALADGEINNGQDFTRPVRRVELIERYDDMTGSAWGDSVVLRAGLPLELRKGWKLSLRAELPYMWTKGVNIHNSEGTSEQGFSEVLTEALFIAPAKGKWTYVFGAQYIPPSASKKELGTGRYQLVPSAGFKYDMNGWMDGAWFAIMARQAVDVAGYSDFSHINQTIIQPMFNINLPDRWFLTFAPECRYDWEKDKYFIPFDITAGKMITKKIVLSAEYKSAIADDLQLFVNEFDVRVGYFF